MRFVRHYLLHFLFCMALVAGIVSSARASDLHAGVQVMNRDGTDITIIDGDVVIHSTSGSVAHITPAGDFVIDGKPVAIDESQRKMLQQYASGIRTIEQQGIDIGKQAVHMLGGFVGVLVSDLLSGTNEKQMDQDVKSKAMPLKDAAKALCDTVKTQRGLQDQIVMSLPAFKPYAVIDTDTENDCHVDNNEE